MSSMSSLDRIPIPAVEPERRTPRLFVVESPQRTAKRSATESWLLAFMLLSCVTFAALAVKYIAAPAVNTVSASSPAASSFDGP